MNKFASIALALLICGCAAKVSPTIKSIDTLAPGLVQTKKTGEPMLEQGLIKSINGFMARTTAYPSPMDGVVFPMIKKGDTWSCTKRLDDGDFVCDNAQYFKREASISAARPLNPERLGFVIKPWGEFRGLYYADTGRISEQPEALKGLFVPIEVPLTETFKHELIYEGRIDDNVKITYLEFGEDFTKPTYFQGLTFNISSLNIISIRDIMIEVLSADEKEIQFIVKN